jgi:hypothetical protein
MRKIIVSFVLASILSSHSFAAASNTAKDTIQQFYQKYLSYNYNKTPNLPRPALKYSLSLNQAIAKNEAICKKYVEGICGWAAEGDEYLNAQESDPNLSYKNSQIKITEASPNTIQVKLNVYPSVENTDGYYLRTITYKMIQEGGNWVADDILYDDEISSRKRMEDENAAAIAYPDKKP